MAKHILIVDSEEVIREIVADTLVSAGYEPCVAASGSEALALLEKHKFDLMLTNVLLMPDMDGFTLMERTLQKYPDMTVVFVSAVREPEIIIQTFRSGARDYVLIPFQRENILSVIHGVLGRDR